MKRRAAPLPPRCSLDSLLQRAGRANTERTGRWNRAPAGKCLSVSGFEQVPRLDFTSRLPLFFPRQCLESEMWWRGEAHLLFADTKYNVRLSHRAGSVIRPPSLCLPLPSSCHGPTLTLWVLSEMVVAVMTIPKWAFNCELFEHFYMTL